MPLAIVTGGATGVGAATALRLARAGFSVAVLFNSSASDADAVVSSARAAGARVAAKYQCDVTSDASVRAAVASAAAELGDGAVDVLVHCAGATRLIPFSDMDGATDEVWASLFDVNCTGAFRVVRAAAPLLAASVARGGGVDGRARVVLISSVAARLVQGSSLPYACSKAAVDALVVGLARTLAPTTVVNGVAPGFIEGDWLRTLLGDGFDASLAGFQGAAPLRAVCTPDDVAEAVVGVALGSKMVTGTVLTVDGGMVIQGFVPLKSSDDKPPAADGGQKLN